ncbi:SAG family member [Eimeria brunetti]|uniref:SAG family member n=1 Tax=Eimeria brunetti TaxID=51314 RepID=U6LAM4_9EIME|nr:SAG family member [Eimeria brunetti]
MDSRSYAYLSVKLARNGKLPVHINDVATDTDLVSSLGKIVGDEQPQTDTSCEALIKTKKELLSAKSVYHYVLESQNEPDYRQLLQTSLDKGLKAFTTKAYPKTDSEWQQVWENADFANLAYLLSSNSTTVGCVVGKCTKEESAPDRQPAGEAQRTVEMSLLICDLDPPATRDKAPFDEDYFTGLIARTAQLADMTADDLKAPTNDGTAAAAVPTIMLAGFVAMLTAVAA